MSQFRLEYSARLAAAEERLRHLAARRRLAPLLVLVYAVIGTLWLGLTPPDRKRAIDLDYGPQVENLLNGHGFIFPGGKVADRYPPLHPLLVAGEFWLAGQLGVSPVVVAGTVSLTLTCLSALFLYRLASLVFPRLFAVAASLLFFTHPFILLTLLLPWSETTFNVFFYLAVLLFFESLKAQRMKGNRFLLIGVLLGASMLTRPVALFAPLLFAAFLLFAARSSLPVARRWALGGLLISGSILTVLPWEVFLLRHKTKFVLLSSGDLPSMRDGLSFNHKTFRQPINLPADVEELTDRVWEKYPTLTSKGKVFRMISEEFRESPLTVLKLYVIKASRVWYGTDSQRHKLENLNLVIGLVYFLPSAAGLLFAFREAADRRMLAKLVLVLTVYFWAMATVVLSIVRYMVPMVGLLVLFFPSGVASVLRKLGTPAGSSRPAAESA